MSTTPTIDDLMQHADSLYRFAISRVKNHHAAEDLVQEALLAAWQKISSFDGRSQLSTWLIGILRFKIIDHFRRSDRTPTERSVDPGGEGEDEEDPLDRLFTPQGAWKVDPNHHLDFLSDRPDEKAWHEEILELVRQCLTRLPERLRLLFTLREVDGVDVPAAAAAAGVTSGTAAVLLTRSRQRIRACLQEHDVEP